MPSAHVPYPLRLGVVGTNFVSEWLVQAAAQLPMVQVTAVYSRAQATGQDFAARCDLPLVFDSLEALLACPQVDAVYLASPNACHCQQALAAAAAGKHILCEKPVALERQQLTAMRQAAQQNGVVLMEAMRPLYDPALQLIRQQLPVLGPLRRVTLEFCQYSSRYDAFLAGQRPRAFDPALGNAALMDIGVYCTAVCAALFGLPQQIQAASTFLENGFEAGGSMLLSYEGFQTEIVYSKVCQSVAPSVFLGENGALTVDRLSTPRSLQLHLRPGAGPQTGPRPAAAAAPQPLAYAPAENNMVYELETFAGLVYQGRTAHRGLEVSDIQMAILDEARRQTGVRFIAGN